MDHYYTNFRNLTSLIMKLNTIKCCLTFTNLLKSIQMYLAFHRERSQNVNKEDLLLILSCVDSTVPNCQLANFCPLTRIHVNIDIHLYPVRLYDTLFHLWHNIQLLCNLRCHSNERSKWQLQGKIRHAPTINALSKKQKCHLGYTQHPLFCQIPSNVFGKLY